MPRHIQTYTECAGPGQARSHYNLTGFLGWIVNTMLDSTTLGKAALVVLFLTAFIALIIANPVTAILTFAVIMAALQEAKDWYYKGRLLCIDDQEPCEECKESGSECKNTCAIGTVADAVHNNFDGDGVFNLMLAPYEQRDHLRLLLQHIDQNRNLLQQPGPYNDPPFILNGGVPIKSFWGSVGIPDNFNPNLLDDPTTTATQIDEHRVAISGFFGGLRGAGFQQPYKEIGSNLYNHMLIGFVDRVLSDPTKNFFKHFFRKDPAKIVMGSPTWNAIPQDFDATVPWQAVDGSTTPLRLPNQYWLPGTNFGLNAMFRFNHAILAPFLHCEIDGSKVSRLIDTIMVALAAFMVAWLFLSAIFGPAIGAFLAILLAILAILIAGFIDNLTGGGDAGAPDVDYEDPEEEPLPSQGDGDVVATYGRWIMDTEHGEYFEIHPVLAYYIMARDGLSSSAQLVDSAAERKERGFERYTNSEITKEMADEICGLICKYENGNDDVVILRTASQALSYGLTTRYGGAGFVIP
ncbi:hypothetical protein BH10PSE7_BH10PSE7_34180 [soil metagenome]